MCVLDLSRALSCTAAFSHLHGHLSTGSHHRSGNTRRNCPCSVVPAFNPYVKYPHDVGKPCEPLPGLFEATLALRCIQQHYSEVGFWKYPRKEQKLAALKKIKNFCEMILKIAYADSINENDWYRRTYVNDLSHMRVSNKTLWYFSRVNTFQIWKKSHLPEPHFSPGCLQVSPSNSMAEFQNRLYFINAAEYMNFNSLAINTTLCCCRDAWQAERRLLPAPLPLLQQAADMFCSKICECRSPSSLKFCVSLLVEVTLTTLHYIRATWKMGSESETAYCKR